MSALTETTSNVTEFAGKFKIAIVEVDGSTATNDTVTIDEMDTVVGAVATMAEIPAANEGSSVFITDITDNRITCQEYEEDLTTQCTQSAKDFYLLAVGY